MILSHASHPNGRQQPLIGKMQVVDSVSITVKSSHTNSGVTIGAHGLAESGMCSYKEGLIIQSIFSQSALEMSAISGSRLLPPPAPEFDATRFDVFERCLNDLAPIKRLCWLGSIAYSFLLALKYPCRTAWGSLPAFRLIGFSMHVNHVQSAVFVQLLEPGSHLGSPAGLIFELNL